MKSLWRGLTLVMVVLALWFAEAGMVAAQVPTTTVSDTVYRADGTPAGGTVVVSWGAFTTAGGVAVPAGQTTATLGSGGALNLALAPNAGSTPMGSYYTVVYHLNDGTTSKEYWVVPATIHGGAPTKVAAIRNQVLPSSVAMQTVSKQYVDAEISQAQFGPLDTSLYVLKAGDTMTGPLVLPGDPGTSLEAADKNYVDTQVGTVASGLGGKVALLPSTTQTVSQPAGTQLGVNRLNGTLYASQLQTPGGGYGIANALADPDCANGCQVKVDESYVNPEIVNPALINAKTHVQDERGGAEVHVFTDPLSQTLDANGDMKTVNSSRSQVEYSSLGGSTLSSAAATLTENALAGGDNQFPIGKETPPYFKSTYGTLFLEGNYYTEGQHVQAGSRVNCYGVGDCLSGSQIIAASAGLRDPSDEGVHQADVITEEATGQYTGTCTSGCTAGSTSVMTSSTYGGGTQGEGRYLIDTNPAKTITGGSVVDGAIDSVTGAGYADFTGTSFPVSVFLQTAAAALSQPNNVAPGTVTLSIQTSGVPSGFATNTAALPSSSGLACVRDSITGEAVIEMAPYTVVDGTHLQLTLRKVHDAKSTVAVGGLCGYGIEQTVDTVYERQVLPVLGSTSATRLLYATSNTPYVGYVSPFSSTGFANYTLTVASISRTSNVVKVTLSAPLPANLNGLTLTVSGVADSSYNGSYTVTTTSQTTLTYPNSGPDSTSTGGTLTLLTGGYVLYPTAEVTSVYDPATKTVDGLFTLAPNNVNWATGDGVEEDHYYVMDVYPDTEYVGQFTPRPSANIRSGGKTFTSGAGPGLSGWKITNAEASSEYLGGGGTHQPPNSAFISAGVWSTNFEADAGVNAVLDIHCNLHGCNRWDSAYDVLRLDSKDATDRMTFDPNSDTTTFNMNGGAYSFSPFSFTAGTINVGTLNATTITGGISGSSITSGTIAAARLPIFGPSGATHAPGAVPDPGATAGNARYLREDGTWNIPSGGGSGGSPTGAAGGDLGGAYPNPTVVNVHATGGISLDTAQPSGYTASLLNYGSGNNSLLFSYGCCGSNVLVFGDPSSAGLFMSTGVAIGGGSYYAAPFRGFAVGASGQFQINQNGYVTNAAGLGSGSSANNDLVGTLTVSAGSTTSASLTFARSYSSAPVCLVQPQNATPATVNALAGWSAQVSTTTLSVNVGTAPGSAVTFGYTCVARN